MQLGLLAGAAGDGMMADVAVQDVHVCPAGIAPIVEEGHVVGHRAPPRHPSEQRTCGVRCVPPPRVRSCRPAAPAAPCSTRSR